MPLITATDEIVVLGFPNATIVYSCKATLDGCSLSVVNRISVVIVSNTGPTWDLIQFTLINQVNM